MRLTLINLERIKAVGEFLADEFTSLTGRIRAAWNVEHTESDGHADVTAYSLTLTKDVEEGWTGSVTAGGDGKFSGDVIAKSASGAEVALGTLVTVNGAAFLPGMIQRYGVLIGGVSLGHVILNQPKSAVFAGGGTRQLAVYDLEASATIPMLQIAKDAGTYSLIDGGVGSTRVGFGSVPRPLLAVITDDIYAGNGLHERGRGLAAGEYTPVAFNAANFTASAGAWTVVVGNQTTYRYSIVGKTLHLAWSIGSTNVTVGGTLRLAIPGGFTAAAYTETVYRAVNAGAASVAALARVQVGGTYVELFPLITGGAYGVTAANNTDVHGSFTFEIQ